MRSSVGKGFRRHTNRGGDADDADASLPIRANLVDVESDNLLDVKSFWGPGAPYDIDIAEVGPARAINDPPAGGDDADDADATSPTRAKL